MSRIILVVRSDCGLSNLIDHAGKAIFSIIIDQHSLFFDVCFISL